MARKKGSDSVLIFKKNPPDSDQDPLIIKHEQIRRIRILRVRDKIYLQAFLAWDIQSAFWFMFCTTHNFNIYLYGLSSQQTLSFYMIFKISMKKKYPLCKTVSLSRFNKHALRYSVLIILAYFPIFLRF